VLALFLAGLAAEAQIQVSLSIPRRLYVVYEPIIATVSVTNRAGRDLVLRDGPSAQWFGFQISSGEGRLVPPRSPDYKLDPLTIAAGETVKRSVNLTALYPVTEFGMYRVRATIFAVEMDRYFTSEPDLVEISDGKLVWQRVVGVPAGAPGAGENRTISLLTFRQPKDNMLYVRVEDPDSGIVHATYPLARVLSKAEPEIQLDRDNILHVLQLVGPKMFTYSRIGSDGEYLATKNYTQSRTRPSLRATASGTVEIVGGQVAISPEEADKEGRPKLSDRPAGMPDE
jgi:hypothetical protein